MLSQQPTLEAQNPAPVNERHPWTEAHGFYAIMGGLAIQIPANLPESKRFLPFDAEEISFFTHKGVEALSSGLCERDVLPNLLKEEIKSKSKANGLGKALVCVQALWFIVQCWTRRMFKGLSAQTRNRESFPDNFFLVIQRMPISLLELNTLGHAICALLIYLLWWEKPFEVEYPTMIQNQSLWEARALGWMCESHHQSPVAASLRKQMRTCLNSEPRLKTLSEVRIFPYCSEILSHQNSLVLDNVLAHLEV